MRQLVPSVVVLFLTMSVNAQIQKSRNNRVYVDEDYEYTEAARRTRTIDEQLQKGLSHLHLGDYKTAEQDFRNVVALDERSASAWHFLGFALDNLNENDEALSCYLRALEIDNSMSVTWNNLGHAYLKLNKLDPASDAFTKALAIDPNSIESLNGLCVVQAQLKQSEQAISTCNKARALKPSLSTTYYLAWSFLDLKQYPEAIALLKDCVRSDPNNTTLYVALAEGYYRLKKLDEALSYAQTATQISPDSQAAYASMGYIYFEMKKLKEAKRVFEKALSIDPAFGSARYNLAMTCLAMKEKDCAREQYAILKTSQPLLSDQLLDIIYSSKVVRLMK